VYICQSERGHDMKNHPVLSVRNLSVSFSTETGTVQAVDNVALDLFPGDTLGLVGESGSGKSVTALAVMRLLSRSAARITSGEVWFRHPQKGMMDLLKTGDEQMQHLRGRHIAMIFQEPMTSLNPVQRCGPQVVESILWHKQSDRKKAKEKALDLFREVRLPAPADVYRSWPHELSGGQKQRVMIAMAMACDPLILIADEPTTALDVTVQKSILDLIRLLQERHGMAVLFISHDLGVIHEVAHRTSVMRHGRVVEHGPVQKVFNQPVDPYTRALVACRPSLKERPESLAIVDDFLVGATSPAPPGTSPVSSGTSPAPSDTPSWYGKAIKGEPVLEVKQLNTYFVRKKSALKRVVEYHKAVEDISFKVYKGETLGLVGESGCGKTTLGRSIMRLINPRSGQVIYKGVDIARFSSGALKKLRPKFQIIFQDPYASLTPGISVGNAIMEPMRVHGILENNKDRKQKIFRLLEQVGLEEQHYYRYPHEFSGGQRQRICIARALALDPEFIICDESVSALDVSVQAQVLNLLNTLKKQFGLTYIFISHDLSVVKYMSDRIMVMQNGRMVEFNEADQLYAHPESEYTRSLIEAIPVF